MMNLLSHIYSRGLDTEPWLGCFRVVARSVDSFTSWGFISRPPVCVKASVRRCVSFPMSRLWLLSLMKCSQRKMWLFICKQVWLLRREHLMMCAFFSSYCPLHRSAAWFLQTLVKSSIENRFFRFPDSRFHSSPARQSQISLLFFPLVHTDTQYCR